MSTDDRVAELIKTVEADQRKAYDIAAEHPESELLQATWTNLDAALTLLRQYQRLLREPGVPAAK